MTDSGPVPRVPIVDSHQHVWDVSAHAQPWLQSDEALAPLRRNFSLSDLAPLAAAAGVSGTVIVQTITEPGETPELLALAYADSLAAAVVGWTELTATDVAAALAGLRALPGGSYLAGIRHPLLTEPDPDWLARSDVRRGLAAVASAGLAFDLVLQPHQLPAAVQAAAALPDLTFVLDHFGNVDVETGREMDQSWARSFSALAALPNTVCKLSGILSAPSVAQLRPYFHLALESFGPSRLLFGSDWPVCTLSASYAHVVAAAIALTSELTGLEQAAIMAGTARRVYRIAAS